MEISIIGVPTTVPLELHVTSTRFFTLHVMMTEIHYYFTDSALLFSKREIEIPEDQPFGYVLKIDKSRNGLHPLCFDRLKLPHYHVNQIALLLGSSADTIGYPGNRGHWL